MSGRATRLDLGLGYDHATGALGRYFDGLEAGRAEATRCGSCGRVWFPPHLACPEDGGDCAWLALDGTGTVVGATDTAAPLPFGADTAPRTFVLVALDGADNAAFGRLADGDAGAARVGMRVRLATAEGPHGHPAQAAVFKVEDGG